MLVASLLAGGLTLASAWTGDHAAVAPEATSPASPVELGRVRFPAGYQGHLDVVAADNDTTVAAVTLGRPLSLTLPPGRYTLRDQAGAVVATVAVEAGDTVPVSLPDEWKSAGSDPSVAADDAPAGASVAPDRVSPVVDVQTGRLGPPPPQAAPAVEQVRRRRWKRWAAPLFSAVVPGAGQVLNRQPGRGLAAFTATVGLGLGTAAVWAARDSGRGAAPGDPGGAGREVVRLGGLAALGSAAGLVYVAQVLDAHAQAAGRKRPRPMKRHRASLEVSRFASVAFAPGPSAYQLYTDWSVAAMAQVVPRVSLGLSDASIKYSGDRQRLTLQAGARGAYRFYDRRRVWLSAGGGVLFQGTRAAQSPGPLAPTDADEAEGVERAFTVAPYVHLDARLFILDRWSVGLVPRVSVPLLARRFGRGRTLPRYATTFELGATMGVLF